MASSSAGTQNLHEGPDLLEQVRRSLHGVPPERREASIEAWVASLRAQPHLSRLVALLAAAPEPELRQLALLLAPDLAAPLKRPLRGQLRRLLADRALPVGPQLAVAAQLVRQAAARGSRLRPELRALVSGLGKPQVVDRMRRLERLTGPLPEVAAYRQRYENKMKMRCPRCEVRLPRGEMIKHLWLVHGRVIVGSKVRRPWSLIEDWLEAYRRDGNPAWLERAQMLARSADPEEGLIQLYRLLLLQQLDRPEARQYLLDEAKRRQASVCPHCFALMASPDEAAVKPLRLRRGGLKGRGFRVSVSERGPLSTVRIRAPGGYELKCLEPGRRLTARGAMLLFAGPLVLLALLLDLLVSGRSVLVPVICLLLAAGALALSARVWWRSPEPALARAIDYAWTLLVPQLYHGGYQEPDSSFLAGLALASAGRGRARKRSEQLLRVLEVTEEAVAAGTGPVAHLGALWHLAVEDAAWGGVDPIAFAVAQAARCLEGKLPVAFAEQLFSGWQGERLEAAQRARLRILLADRAFEAGCEVRDLIEMGRRAPAFGAALGTDNLDYVAQLRLLWSLRPTRPWADCGASATAFELAADVERGGPHLAKHADLLLVLADLPGGYVCSRGILFHEVLFTEPPATLEMKARSYLQGGGFELIVGEQRFWFQTDPAAVLVRLERWFRYYFREFRPRAGGVFGWPSHAHWDRPRGHQLMRCPECGRKVRFRAGNIAVAAT